MLGGWRTRSFFLAVPILLAALALRGEQPWMVNALVWSVFFFCLFRSIGAASGISWFYAILPEGARGRYFASDQFAAAVAECGHAAGLLRDFSRCCRCTGRCWRST
jgi:hypothetical protein